MQSIPLSIIHSDNLSFYTILQFHPIFMLIFRDQREISDFVDCRTPRGLLRHNPSRFKIDIEFEIRKRIEKFSTSSRVYVIRR